MGTRNIDTHFRDYLIHCKNEKNLNQKTQKAYEIDLCQYAQFAKTKGSAYCKECLQLYIIHLQNNYKVKSAKRKTASLKAFFNYLDMRRYWKQIHFQKFELNYMNRFCCLAQSHLRLLVRCCTAHIKRNRPMLEEKSNDVLAYVTSLYWNSCLLRGCVYPSCAR